MTQQEKAKIAAMIYDMPDTPGAEPWHPASENPERTDGWFLALTKENLPFLTHYIKGWLPQVYVWKYIDIPTAPL